MIVDACEKGWGAILYKEGKAWIAAGPATQPSWRSSTVSEPWGWQKAAAMMCEDGDSVLVLSDNEPLTHTIRKRHAKGWHYNEAMRRTLCRLPNTQWHSMHIQGEFNLADAPSRGEPLTKEAIEKFVEHLDANTEHKALIEAMKRDIGTFQGLVQPYRQGLHRVDTHE